MTRLLLNVHAPFLHVNTPVPQPDQEEIRFLLCPELLVSRLLAETMAPHEAVLMRGFERFSSYTGYASSFAFAGRYDDGGRPAGVAGGCAAAGAGGAAGGSGGAGGGGGPGASGAGGAAPDGLARARQPGTQLVTQVRVKGVG